MISKIVNRLQDLYTGFYTKIIVEHKMEKDSYKVLKALQEMGSKMLTSAQGRKDEKETLMYTGGTGASTKQTTGQLIDNWQKDARCYWCRESGHKKFN